MKKACIVFLLFSLRLGTLNAQGMREGLHDFTHSYFRADPFQGEFSSFVKALVNDPGYSSKVFHVRTDTSLFFFSGVYTIYNPFFFKPTRVEITLREVPFKYTEGMLIPDTILVYQLTAHAEAGDKGMEDVRKEFEKIHKRYYRKFFDSNLFDLKSEGITDGAIHNYFVPFYTLAPLSVAWGRTNKECILNITLRIKPSANMAELPKPLDNP